MKITIITVGVRGDVWPFMALGLELQQGGRHVTMATRATFEEGRAAEKINQYFGGI